MEMRILQLLCHYSEQQATQAMFQTTDSLATKCRGEGDRMLLRFVNRWAYKAYMRPEHTGVRDLNRYK